MACPSACLVNPSFNMIKMRGKQSFPSLGFSFRYAFRAENCGAFVYIKGKTVEEVGGLEQSFP